MKIFLSWSGEMSHKVALVLRDWLPSVIQIIKPFISSDDIDKGERWSDALAGELEDTQYGIICITPFNINSAWLNFEAGALSKAVKQSSVAPFLFGVSPPLSKGPLQQFQLTTYDKEDIFSLLSSVNKRLESTDQLSNELLRREFEVWWPQLQTDLDEINDNPGTETQTGIPWLYSEEDLVRRQVIIECNEIWIITPNLFNSASELKIKGSLQKNLNRGVIYTLIIPDSNTEMAKEELRGISSSKPDQIYLKNIDNNEFHDSAITDYIILNPNFTDTYALHVYLELPNTSRGYWIEVDDDQEAMNLVSRFRKFAEKV